MVPTPVGNVEAVCNLALTKTVNEPAPTGQQNCLRCADLRPEALNEALSCLRHWPNGYLPVIYLSQFVLARLTITRLMEQPGGVSDLARPLDQRNV